MPLKVVNRRQNYKRRFASSANFKVGPFLFSPVH